MAAPAPVEERRLENHVGARAHRFNGLGVSGFQLTWPGIGDLDDREALLSQRSEVAELVLVAKLSNELHFASLIARALELTERSEPVQLSEMLTRQVVDQVRRAEDG